MMVCDANTKARALNPETALYHVTTTGERTACNLVVAKKFPHIPLKIRLGVGDFCRECERAQNDFLIAKGRRNGEAQEAESGTQDQVRADASADSHTGNGRARLLDRG